MSECCVPGDPRRLTGSFLGPAGGPWAEASSVHTLLGRDPEVAEAMFVFSCCLCFLVLFGQGKSLQGWLPTRPRQMGGWGSVDGGPLCGSGNVWRDTAHLHGRPRWHRAWLWGQVSRGWTRWSAGRWPQGLAGSVLGQTAPTSGPRRPPGLRAWVSTNTTFSSLQTWVSHWPQLTAPGLYLLSYNSLSANTFWLLG